MTVAGRKTLSELEDESGREALKREIALKINDLTRDHMAGTVLDVVFSQFLIQ
jgi:flagellar basal body-associated protein FliL